MFLFVIFRSHFVPWINFSFIMFVVCSLMSKIFTMAIPDNSSMKGAFIMTIFCDAGATSTSVIGKNGIDLLRKPKQDSLKSITPSSSNMFFIPMTKSTLSCISETKVKISNLCPCISIITGITNSTLTYCPFPTCILCVFKENFGNACRVLHRK